MPSIDEAATMRKVYGRLMPLLFAMMFFNYLDRSTSVSPRST